METFQGADHDAIRARAIDAAAELRSYGHTDTPEIIEALLDALTGIPALAAEVERLKMEADESHDLRARMEQLLIGTANGLKGAPDPLKRHDWSDLPTVAAVARARVADLEAENAELRSDVEEGLEDQCSGKSR